MDVRVPLELADVTFDWTGPYHDDEENPERRRRYPVLAMNVRGVESKQRRQGDPPFLRDRMAALHGRRTLRGSRTADPTSGRNPATSPSSAVPPAAPRSAHRPRTALPSRPFPSPSARGVAQFWMSSSGPGRCRLTPPCGGLQAVTRHPERPDCHRNWPARVSPRAARGASGRRQRGGGLCALLEGPDAVAREDVEDAVLDHRGCNRRRRRGCTPRGPPVPCRRAGPRRPRPRRPGRPCRQRRRESPTRRRRCRRSRTPRRSPGRARCRKPERLEM